jgi:predicted cupin superfamily sugar epimerase
MPLSLISRLRLIPHPEGGYYRETHASQMRVRHPAVVDLSRADRPAMTQIYFLLEEGDFSAFHRVRSDETWHLYLGGPLELHLIDQQGNYACHLLGADIADGQEPQITIPANSWQAARLEPGVPFALCGCTVAPGFDFADFAMANRTELELLFPDHQALIAELTRNA